jgi:glycosyltransferase involved in cell wall biosynthesis
VKVGLVVPHIFMHRDILPHVIFSPAQLALALAAGLDQQGVEVILFSPGPVETTVQNITADLSLFEQELRGRGDTYVDLLKKHPFTFITLARQVQGELIAKAYAMANSGELDIVHVYTNEEELALSFASLCTKPVVFTHHDPFNFMVKYKNFMPKYKHLNWISMSQSQRLGMPKDTNWAANIYHGLTNPVLQPVEQPSAEYVAYIGRIIEPKGVHLAIEAVQTYNQLHADAPLKLKIAGKHYAGHKKDNYWNTRIVSALEDPNIEYVGFIDTDATKQKFLANAQALLVPSLFSEPFGMVSLEALACGTPVVALDSGALPEVIVDGETGIVAKKVFSASGGVDEQATVQNLARAIAAVPMLDRAVCRQDYEARFTLSRMCDEHQALYERLIK